jgi:hypothetical protein
LILQSFLLAIGSNGTLPSLRIELTNDGKLTSGGFIEGGRIFEGRISAIQVDGKFKHLEFNTILRLVVRVFE